MICKIKITTTMLGKCILINVMSVGAPLKSMYGRLKWVTM